MSQRTGHARSVIVASTTATIRITTISAAVDSSFAGFLPPVSWTQGTARPNNQHGSRTMPRRVSVGESVKGVATWILLTVDASP
jgi:hypothetical protein